MVLFECLDTYGEAFVGLMLHVQSLYYLPQIYFQTSTLTWDAQHKTNVEQYYCYCGGPGM